MPLRPNMEPREYMAVLVRRKWQVIFTVLLVLFGASVYCVVFPEQFKSSTTILVVPQRVPENYVHSTVSAGIEERLSTIRQQVLSRTRLQAVMDELGLFKEERRKLPLEEVIEGMRKRIEIEVRGSERSRDAFTLSFVHENRQTAMLTASRLASFFIDENLKAREQQAVGTSEFLDAQVQETKKSLEGQEEKVRRYKMSFMGELPQQIQVNLQALSRLQDQMKANADATRSAEDRKIFLEAQASAMESQVNSIEAQAGESARAEAAEQDGSPNGRRSPLAADLASKKARLADLLARYTDRHPEIARLKGEIEGLEKQVAGEEGNGAPSPKRAESAAGTAGRFGKEREEIRRLRAQAGSLGVEASLLKKEREELLKGIADVQARVDRSPKREQEMIALTRDYDNLRQSYDSLLKKKLDADVSQNLEKRQKGEQFQILDPANLPEDPFRPDRKRVFGIAVLAALILGLGGAMGVEAMDQTLRGPAEFRHFFGLPILAGIPIVGDAEYERTRAIRKALVLGGLVSFSAAVTIFLVMYGQKIRTIIQF